MCPKVTPVPVTLRSDLGYPVEADREDFCRQESGGYMNDMAAGGANSPFVCEFDVQPATFSISKAFSNELFLRGAYVELGISALGSFGTT